MTRAAHMRWAAMMNAPRRQGKAAAPVADPAGGAAKGSIRLATPASLGGSRKDNVDRSGQIHHSFLRGEAPADTSPLVCARRKICRLWTHAGILFYFRTRVERRAYFGSAHTGQENERASFSHGDAPPAHFLVPAEMAIAYVRGLVKTAPPHAGSIKLAARPLPSCQRELPSRGVPSSRQVSRRGKRAPRHRLEHASYATRALA